MPSQSILHLLPWDRGFSMNDHIRSGRTDDSLKTENYLLREEAGGLLAIVSTSKKFLYIEDHRTEFRVEKMCQVLGVLRSGFYKWRQSIGR